MATNMLSGEVPDFSSAFPNLRVLDLSNQERGNQTGLSGPIPESISNLNFLTTLILGGNSLSGVVPPVVGNMRQLSALDLSDNQLRGFIPASFGKLDGESLFLQLYSLPILNFTQEIHGRLSYNSMQ